MDHKDDILGLFAYHKVAANLLMIIMILAGLLSLYRLNIQFFPNFELDVVTVRVVWQGASAEDMETGITIPLEQNLKTVDNLNKMTSTSSRGVSVITLEFIEGTDIVLALDQVKQKVAEFRNFPEDAETPKISHVSHYEQIASIIVTGGNLDELRPLAREFEQQLLQQGIDKVIIRGLPEEEIVIEAQAAILQQLQLSLDNIAQKVNSFSQDVPAGIVGDKDSGRELRSLDQQRQSWEFAQIPIERQQQNYINLGDIAHIEKRPKNPATLLTFEDQPALELSLKRAESGNSLKAARILSDWLAQTRPTLPPNIKLTVYDESWQLIQDRMDLLLRNGFGGLVLVVAILYLFLNGRVAFWVAVGIPVSFMATLGVLYLAGGSINMISLFGMIMALGIIVDDAIVVGEDALAHYQSGEPALSSAEGGARRMLAPVMSSSLTTIAAFLPLMMISGIIGNILFAIPLVIVCVIIASLIESFFVLPGHLRHAFLHLPHQATSKTRQTLEQGFAYFRDHIFYHWIRFALEYRQTSLSIAMALLLFAFGLLVGGRLQFSFFPSPESSVLYANATFVAGTPEAKVHKFLQHLESTLAQTQTELGQDLVLYSVTRYGATSGRRNSQSGEQFASITLELLPSDQRQIRNEEFIKTWKQFIQIPPALDNLSIAGRRAGPPGRDISVRLTGNNSVKLKQASLELQEVLKGIAGVSDVEDDLPYGYEQLVYRITPEGEALGLTTAEIGRQLRTAFNGRLIQIFQQGTEEIEVKIQLPQAQQDHLHSLNQFEIKLNNGEFVPLNTVVSWQSQRGFQALRHAEGQLAVDVSGNVDRNINNNNTIIASLQQHTLPELKSRYGISYSFEGRAAEQKETLADMKVGLLLGLTLIYLVLAWVFASYGWPLIVMMAIPFGLIGAILGHWLLDIDLTILSLFGFFGLSGIVVNDSIILVIFYKKLREQYDRQQALIQATCQRLRAVLLTSLTTIAGLTPLLFETSFQAQFLIPMATSIAFGLMFSTFLVLLVIPVLLSYYEQAYGFFTHRH